MKRSAAIKLRRYIEIAVQSLPDSEALEVVTLYPEWVSGIEYNVSYKVQRNGKLWRCLQSHTSQTGWEPESAPSLWAKVLIPDETVVPEWKQPDSTNPYNAGNKVTHNDKMWGF